MKVDLLKPLCGPKYNHPSGAKNVEVPAELGKALIADGAAVLHKDPANEKAAQKAAVKEAKKALDTALKADIADVKAQLKTDKVQPGAKHPDLEAAANAVIEELKAKATEAKEAL